MIELKLHKSCNPAILAYLRQTASASSVCHFQVSPTPYQIHNNNSIFVTAHSTIHSGIIKDLHSISLFICHVGVICTDHAHTIQDAWKIWHNKWSFVFCTSSCYYYMQSHCHMQFSFLCAKYVRKKNSKIKINKTNMLVFVVGTKFFHWLAVSERYTAFHFVFCCLIFGSVL